MWPGATTYLGPTAYLGLGDDQPIPEVEGTAIEWDQATLLDVPEADFVLEDLRGWEDLPDARTSWAVRPGQHGSFDAPVLAGPRTVFAIGHTIDVDRRDELLHALQRSTGLTSGAMELRITNAGRTLSAAARLTRFRASQELWPTGVIPWSIEWVCPDPMRYGALQQRYTGLPEQAGGLRFPLFSDGDTTTGVLEFGEGGASGRVLLVNEGTAPAEPVFEVRGPAPSGFTLQEVSTGRRIVSVTNIPAGSALVVNTATGTALLDGVDRSGQLRVQQWHPVPPGGQSEWFFTAPEHSAAAVVASVRSTWW